jgi:hypothetical protein
MRVRYDGYLVEWEDRGTPYKTIFHANTVVEAMAMVEEYFHLSEAILTDIRKLSIKEMDVKFIYTSPGIKIK